MFVLLISKFSCIIGWENNYKGNNKNYIKKPYSHDGLMTHNIAIILVTQRTLETFSEEHFVCFSLSKPKDGKAPLYG